MKYNSLLYSERKRQFKDCLRKADELEQLLNGEINDPLFHFDYAKYYYKLGEELKNKNDLNYIETHCLFIKKFKFIVEKNPNSNELTAQLTQLHSIAYKDLHKIFNEKLNSAEVNILRVK